MLNIQGQVKELAMYPLDPRRRVKDKSYNKYSNSKDRVGLEYVNIIWF